MLLHRLCSDVQKSQFLMDQNIVIKLFSLLQSKFI